MRNAARNLAPRACTVCGARFQPYRGTQVTCSPSCNRKQPHIIEAERRRHAKPETRERKNAVRRISTNPERREVNRRSALLKYGLTPDQFDALADAQGGLCAICGEPPSGRGIAAVLHVDHDHDTGQVRGLLCTICNRALGYFKDDLDRMRKASEYLLQQSDLLR